MRSIMLFVLVLGWLALPAQNYFSAPQASQKLQAHQARLSELHLKLLARETPKGGYESRWKSLYQEALALEGVMACADSEWFYGQFEPQLYVVQESVLDPEAFFSALTRLVALTAYKYESIAAAYERKACAHDGVRDAVHQGRMTHKRQRPGLKGIVPSSN